MGLSGVPPSDSLDGPRRSGEGSSPHFIPCSAQSSPGKTMCMASQCALPQCHCKVSSESWAETHLAVEKPMERNEF